LKEQSGIKKKGGPNSRRAVHSVVKPIGGKGVQVENANSASQNTGKKRPHESVYERGNIETPGDNLLYSNCRRSPSQRTRGVLSKKKNEWKKEGRIERKKE